MLNQPYTWVITGGAGFIGSHLAKTLVAQGQRVRIFDNFSSGRKENLAPIANQVQIIEGDICDFNALLPALKGADFVLHHAALVSVPESVQKPLATWQINVQGTANVLEAARQNRIRRVVFACSSAIYGNGPDLPYYTQVYGLETVSLVYFNVFGPHQNPNSPYAAVIAKFMQLAAEGKPLGIDWDGLQSRDFVHVRDVVQANLLAALKGAPGETYNVAGGKTYSLLDLADRLDKISGQKLPRVFRPKREGDVKLSSADISHIKTLGFVPQVTLEEGLAELWQLQRGEK